MKTKLLAVLITSIFAVPVAYAQGTTAPKDSGMTKDRPAASGSATTKGDASMKSDKGVKADASAQGDASAKSGTRKNGSPDAVITGKIKTGFIKDKIVRSRNYNVDTKDGMVTVKGKARTQAELDRALEIAKSTNGVKDVKNEVQLMASADMPKSGKPMGEKAKSDKSAAPATTTPSSKPASGASK